MKLIYTILLFISFAGNATTYYIANAGNDANNGTSIGTAWHTIAKAISVVTTNDSVLLNKGDTWNEKLVPNASHLYFGSYGTGNKPIITALQTQTGFTNVGNVWTATSANSVKDLNTVLIGGSIKAKGRYPNTGFLAYTLSSTTTKIVSSLTGFPNYSGGELAVRSAPWEMEIEKISSQVVDTFNLALPISYASGLGSNGYFIQNIASVLDTTGEWSYDSTSKALKVYALSSPSVQISTIDTLVWLRNKSSITFDGISFQGANVAAMQLDTSSSATIKNCSFNYNGFSITGKKSDSTSIKKDSIQNSLISGICLTDLSGFINNTCNYSIIDSNYIKNTGILPGMSSGLHRDEGITIAGINNTITNNRIDSTGYNGLTFFGKNSLVKDNFITNFLTLQSDGGGIYTWNSTTYFPNGYSDSSIIRHNIIINGTAPAAGISSATPIATGVYLDNETRRIRVDSNLIQNTVYGGLYGNQDSSISIFDNTIIDTLASCILLGNVPASDFNIKRNIAFQRNSSLFVFNRTQPSFSGNSIDSNYYLRPVAEANKFNLNSTTYSLSGWITATGYDTNSKETPAGINFTNYVVCINPTNSDSTIHVAGSYLDVKGNLYINSVSLPPYGSILLFKTSQEIYNRQMNRILYNKLISL